MSQTFDRQSEAQRWLEDTEGALRNGVCRRQCIVPGRCKLCCDYEPDKHLLNALRAGGVAGGGIMFLVHGILPEMYHTITTSDRVK